MPNYAPAPVAGTAYRRANAVILGNPLGGSPSVAFQEEDIVIAGGATFATPAGTLNLPYDPAAVVQVLDPTTDQPTGMTVFPTFTAPTFKGPQLGTLPWLLLRHKGLLCSACIQSAALPIRGSCYRLRKTISPPMPRPPHHQQQHLLMASVYRVLRSPMHQALGA